MKIRLFVGVMLLFISSGVQANTAALWLFDEPKDTPCRALLEDWTVNGCDLTIENGARISVGRSGNCLDILGSGGRTAIRRYIDNTPLNLGNSDWTWEFYLKMKAMARPGDILFQMREGPFDRGPKCGFQAGADFNQLVFICEKAGIEQVVKTSYDLFRCNIADWRHVAFAYDFKSRTLTHWVDGKQMDSVTLKAALSPFESNGENNISIGADINGWHALPAFFDEMRVSKGVLYKNEFTPPESFAPSVEPITLSKGPHLFIDETLIARSDDLARTTHQPKRLPEPVIRQHVIREGWEQQYGTPQVMYDSELKIFRLWTGGKNLGFKEEADIFHTTYWESKDGVNWTAPELGIIEFAGDRKNNMILTGRTHNMRFGCYVIDTASHETDPNKRFKLGYFPLDWRQDHTNGMNVAFSPDGIHWTPYEKNPVLKHWDVCEGHPGAGVTVADINDFFYDEERKLYVQTYKTYALPGEYPMMAVKRDARWRELNDPVPGYRRLIGFCTSPDFINWGNFQRALVPDDKDAPELQFYSMSLIKRGDLYIGHVRCLDDQAEADGTGWMELATSRDLYRWTRHRDVFFDRNSKPGLWDSAIAWHSKPAIKGDEMYFYYCGMGGGHKSGERNIGMAKLRLDGYVSRDAGSKGGILTTRPLSFSAVGMTVNAEVKGELKARILDEKGQPMPGFDFSDCEPARGNSVNLPVKWKQPLSALRTMPVRIEFSLRNAKLYGFEFHM